MFNIGSGEIALIAVAALLLLGPSRLPELARGIGKFMREFRRQTDEVRSVVEREFYKMDQDMGQITGQLTDLTAPFKPGTPVPPAKLAPTATAAVIGPPATATPATAAPGEPVLQPNPDAVAVGGLEQSQVMKGAPETTPVALSAPSAVAAVPAATPAQPPDTAPGVPPASDKVS